MTARAVDAVVVGAGVIGLSTGICLAESGLKVRIWTSELPWRTTSAAAVAMIGPALNPPADTASSWEQVTIEEFRRLAEVPDTGVHLCRGRLAARQAPEEPVPGFETCTPEELPDCFSFGFWATLPLADIPPYPASLPRRFPVLGGEIAPPPRGTLS